MASQIYITLLVNLFCCAILAAAQTQPANELNLNTNDGSTIKPEPAENTQPMNQNQNQNQPEQNSVIPSQNDQSLSDDSDMVQPIFPNFFRPPRPTPLFDSIFNGQGLMDHFRRHREMMNQQFEQLERQAGEGQEVRSFTRNGVTYVRTCTTKRVE